MAGYEDIIADLPIGDIAAKLGVDEATARKAVDDALPALLAGMGANATDPAGAASLERAVVHHDPKLVEGGVNLADVDEDDVLDVVGIIDAFSLGMGLDLASPDDVWAPETPTETLGRLVAVGPRGTARSDRAFESGLELLLDGLRLRLARYELD